MAKLSTAKRKSLPKSDFGLPGKRAYPMPDKSHAANAKARATQQVKAGNLSSGAKAKIVAKANRVLHEGGHPAMDAAVKQMKRRRKSGYNDLG
jgi:hypothetical protein